MATGKRSPNYPALGLGEAVEALKSFYAEARRTTVDQEAAARALGYSGLNGVARTKLSVLKKYGLFEEISDGKFRVSDLGLRIVVPGTESDVLAALRTAALKSELFREVHASHKDASTAILVSYLVRDRAFTEEGARAFDKAYRETVKVAKLDDPAYIPPDVVNALKGDDSVQREQDGFDRVQAMPPPDAGEVERLRFNLKGGRRVRLLFSGHLPTQADIDKLIANLELNKDTFPEDVDEE